jgi:tryptophan 7-halogenase
VSDEGRVRSVAIVGEGIEAWMVAAALAVAFGGRVTVRIITPPGDSTVAGEVANAHSTLPPLRAFNTLLGMDEDHLIRACAGTFKLGTEFVGWREGSSYIQPCGEFGATLGGVAFHQYLTRLRAAGTAVRPEEYCLAAIAARAGSFARPSQDPSSVESTMTYALHLDGARYREQLVDVARRHGASAVRGLVGEVVLSQDRYITALILHGGERIEADLFVDASGEEARLIGEALGVAFEDWSDVLPCSRHVSARREQKQLRAPLTLVQAAEFGWMTRVPLQGSVECGYTYDPTLLDDGSAARALLEWMEVSPDTTVISRSAKTGRRVAPWQGNCVAIGAAAGFIEPLDSTALHLTQSMIVRFLSLFPTRTPDVEPREYNRLVGNELERTRDLAIAHYATARRADGEFWRRRGSAPIPDSLAYKMAQYASRGKLVSYDQEPVPESAWLALYLGQGIWPKRCEALAEGVDLESVRQQLARMRAAMEQAANAMPPHAAYIHQHNLGAPTNA